MMPVVIFLAHGKPVSCLMASFTDWFWVPSPNQNPWKPFSSAILSTKTFQIRIFLDKLSQKTFPSVWKLFQLLWRDLQGNKLHAFKTSKRRFKRFQLNVEWSIKRVPVETIFCFNLFYLSLFFKFKYSKMFLNFSRY